MASEIKVSVVFPIYNAEDSLEEAVRSVMEQSLNNIEIICVNDGSTDGSLQVLKRLSGEDNRIKVISQENLGAGAARNAGIGVAVGEYMMFLDPDDKLAAKNVLLRLFEYASETKTDICGGNIVYNDTVGSGEGYKNFATCGVMDFSQFQDCFFHVRFIISRKLLLDNNILYPKLKRFQDPPFLLNAMVAAGRFSYINIPVYIYTRHLTSREYSYEGIRDLLIGHCDVLKIALKEGLNQLFLGIIEVARNNYYLEFYKHLYYYENQELEEYIREYEALIQKGPVEDKDRYLIISRQQSSVHKRFLSERRKIDTALRSEIVIIYGAGFWGKEIKKYMDQKCPDKECYIATTDGGNDTFSIKELFGIVPKASVIVAVDDKYVAAMGETAHRCGFENVYPLIYLNVNVDYWIHPWLLEN